MNNNTQLASVGSFKAVLNSNDIKARLKNSLKDNWSQFATSMLDLYSSDTMLQKCDPEEVALECIKAATLNLPISKSLGFAYIVPYKNKPTFIIGYKGLIQLAQRTGQYQTINADVVYEGQLKDRDLLSGKIDLSGEKISNKVIGYFAYFKLNNGFEKVLYMSREEVETWKNKYSPSAKSNYSPWTTEFDKMALKTCLRRLISAYGIMTLSMSDAIAKDNDFSQTQQRAEREVKANANSKIIDIDTETGEVKEVQPVPEPVSAPAHTPEITEPDF